MRVYSVFQYQHPYPILNTENQGMLCFYNKIVSSEILGFPDRKAILPRNPGTSKTTQTQPPQPRPNAACAQPPRVERAVDGRNGGAPQWEFGAFMAESWVQCALPLMDGAPEKGGLVMLDDTSREKGISASIITACSTVAIALARKSED